jgi:LacI family transcriptional regulator
MARITVKDISTKLNISLGTVSKALSGKEGVNTETRKLIIETANTMGYKVNKLAQSLSRNPFLVGVLMPSAWPEYYGFLEMGIKDGFSSLRDYNLYSLFTYVPSLFSRKEIEKAEEFIEQQNVNAVIICPALDPSYKQLIHKGEMIEPDKELKKEYEIQKRQYNILLSSLRQFWVPIQGLTAGSVKS